MLRVFPRKVVSVQAGVYPGTTGITPYPRDKQVKAWGSWVIAEECVCNLGESHVCICSVRFGGFLTN